MIINAILLLVLILAATTAPFWVVTGLIVRAMTGPTLPKLTGRFRRFVVETLAWPIFFAIWLLR